MTKYCVSNCPAFDNTNYAECKSFKECSLQCFNNTDCLLKKIIGLCEDAYKDTSFSDAKIRVSDVFRLMGVEVYE